MGKLERLKDLENLSAFDSFLNGHIRDPKNDLSIEEDYFIAAIGNIQDSQIELARIQLSHITNLNNQNDRMYQMYKQSSYLLLIGLSFEDKEKFEEIDRWMIAAVGDDPKKMCLIEAAGDIPEKIVNGFITLATSSVWAMDSKVKFDILIHAEEKISDIKDPEIQKKMRGNICYLLGQNEYFKEGKKEYFQEGYEKYQDLNCLFEFVKNIGPKDLTPKDIELFIKFKELRLTNQLKKYPRFSKSYDSFPFQGMDMTKDINFNLSGALEFYLGVIKSEARNTENKEDLSSNERAAEQLGQLISNYHRSKKNLSMQKSKLPGLDSIFQFAVANLIFELYEAPLSKDKSRDLFSKAILNASDLDFRDLNINDHLNLIVQSLSRKLFTLNEVIEYLKALSKNSTLSEVFRYKIYAQMAVLLQANEKEDEAIQVLLQIPVTDVRNTYLNGLGLKTGLTNPTEGYWIAPLSADNTLVNNLKVSQSKLIDQSKVGMPDATYVLAMREPDKVKRQSYLELIIKQIDALPHEAKPLYNTFLLSQKVELLEKKCKKLSTATKFGFSKKLYQEVLIETARICSEPLTESQFKTVLEGAVFAIHQSYIKGEKTDYWWLIFLLYAVNPDKMKDVMKNVDFLMKLQNSKHENVSSSYLPGFYMNENSYTAHISQWSIISQSGQKKDYNYSAYARPFYCSLDQHANGIVIFPSGHIFLNKRISSSIDDEYEYIKQIDFYDPENNYKAFQRVFEKLCDSHFNLLSNPEYLPLVNQLLNKNLACNVYEVLYRVLDSALKAAPDSDKKQQDTQYSDLLINLLSKSGNVFREKEPLTNNQWEKLAAVYQSKKDIPNQERALAHIPIAERALSRQRLAIEIPVKEKGELKNEVSRLQVNVTGNMEKVTTLEAYNQCFNMLVQANELEALLAPIKKEEPLKKEKEEEETVPFAPDKSFNIDKFFNAVVLELEAYKNNRPIVSTDVFKVKAENKALALITAAFSEQLKRSTSQQLNFKSINAALDQSLKPDIKLTQGLRTLLETIQTQLNEILRACGLVRPSHANDFGNSAKIHSKF